MTRRISFLARLFKRTLGVTFRDVFKAGMQAQRDSCLFAIRGHLSDQEMARFVRAMDWESARIVKEAAMLDVRERRLRLFSQWDAESG